MVLQKTSIKEIWLTDLVEFEKMLDKVEAEEEEDRKKNEHMLKRDGKGQKAKKKQEKKLDKEKAKPQKKAINWDSDQPQTNTEDIKKNKAKKASKADGKAIENQKKGETTLGLMERVKMKLKDQAAKESGTLNIVAKGD